MTSLQDCNVKPFENSSTLTSSEQNYLGGLRNKIRILKRLLTEAAFRSKELEDLTRRFESTVDESEKKKVKDFLAESKATLKVTSANVNKITKQVDAFAVEEFPGSLTQLLELYNEPTENSSRQQVRELLEQLVGLFTTAAESDKQLIQELTLWQLTHPDKQTAPLEDEI